MGYEAIVLAHESSFAIGEGHAHPALLKLDGPQGAVHVEPLAMSVLVALHRAHGTVLSRDDLTRYCWDGRIVGEDAINRVIGHLRRALSSAGLGSPIETIPRVGFRLGDADPAESSPFVAPSRRALVVGGGAVMGLAAAGLWVGGRSKSLPPEAEAAMERGKVGLIEATSESFAVANAAYREAAAAAPQSADAWGMLALTYANLAWSSEPSAQDENRRRALATADRALQLDRDHGPALAAKLILLPPTLSLFALGQAVESAERRAPSDPQIAKIQSYFWWMVGRSRDGLAAHDRFEKWAGPNPRGLATRATTLSVLGRDDEADLLFNETIERWPRHYAVWFPRFKFLLFSGRGERALAMLDDLPGRPVGISDYNFEVCRRQALACTLRTRAAIDEGMAISLDSAQRGHGYAENAMLFASHVERLDAAFDLAGGLLLKPSTLPTVRFDKPLARYVNRPRPATYLLFAPAAAPMRRDARIGALYHATGLREYWDRTGLRPDIA